MGKTVSIYGQLLFSILLLLLLNLNVMTTL